MRYNKIGTYSEVLEVKDPSGHLAYDFATVNVYGDTDPITINASDLPSLNVKAGQTITFKVRTFGLTSGEETWDFGDGSPRGPVDGNAVKLAKNGYAIITHTYAKPGNYIVTVKNGARSDHPPLGRPSTSAYTDTPSPETAQTSPVQPCRRKRTPG